MVDPSAIPLEARQISAVAAAFGLGYSVRFDSLF
jgi:hypothetical protein